MRLLLAITISALLAGCSSGAGETAKSLSTLTPVTMPSTSNGVTTAAPPSASGPAAPGPGAAFADVIRWIEAGTPRKPAAYGSVTRDGVTTSLDGQVAFTTNGTESNCATNRYRDGALACLVALADPPPRPPDFPTAWKDNWVDFDGASVDIGSPHGDPGPFADGNGAELSAGQTLAFGDYRCRADPAGLLCANDAHQSAVRMSAAGVVPFGCLQEVEPPADIGRRFSC